MGSAVMYDGYAEETTGGIAGEGGDENVEVLFWSDQVG